MDLLIETFNADCSGDLLSFFVSIFENVGTTFEQSFLGARGINTIEPRNVEAVLSTQFKSENLLILLKLLTAALTLSSEFGLGIRRGQFRPLLGCGIFTQDGDPWKASRDLLRPQFVHTRNESFPIIQQIIERFVDSIVTAEEEVPIDLQPLFFELTMDTTMAVLFGRSIDGFSQITVEAESFAKSFDEAQHMLAWRSRLGPSYWILNWPSFRRSCKRVHSCIDKIIAEISAEIEASQPSQSHNQRYVFLKALMSTTKDSTILRDQCINVLLAGRDTTACLLSWTM